MRAFLSAIIILLCNPAVLAKISAKVTVGMAEGAEPISFAIYPSTSDVRDAAIKDSLASGIFECVIEADYPVKYNIVDEGALVSTGRTSRYADFLVEDGAAVKITVGSDGIEVESDGAESEAYSRMKRRMAQLFTPAEGCSEEEADSLYRESKRWTVDYCEKHPMLHFLLDLEDELDNFSFINSTLAAKLAVYDRAYADRYASHPVHQSIAALRGKGLQICGLPYNDYSIRSIDGEVRRASEYYAGRLTAVLCWATWCLPCRHDAIDLKTVYEKYRDRGLNVFAIAHEFGSPDALKAAVEADGYPWPTLYDLDNEFGVFEKHGTSSSGIFLIDSDGKIAAVMFSPDELDAKLSALMAPEADEAR